MSCPTFTITSETYTVYLGLPLPNSEQRKLDKIINRFNFWSENYSVHDDGIRGQPFVLTGIEVDDSEYGICFDGQICFPLCFNLRISHTFEYLMYMSDHNEEVTISGLGNCMDAVYIIKHVHFKTFTPNSKSWALTLEKVR